MQIPKSGFSPQPARLAALAALLAFAVPAMSLTPIVTAGRATSQAKLTGTWTGETGALRGTGMSTLIEGKVGVGTGDFVVTLVVNASAAMPSRAAMLIDDSADIGLATASTANTYVRGFLFGDLTTELNSLASLAPAGSDVTITCRRSGDTLEAAINGTAIWTMPYESNRPLGKIAVRAGSTSIDVKEFSFEGTATSLAGWTDPYTPRPTLPGSVDVFVSGVGGYTNYRIPSLVRTKSGALVAICEGRKNSASDAGDIDLVVKRSTDGGLTWGVQTVAYEEGGTAAITIGNPAPVVDPATGAVVLLFCRNNARIFAGRSTDEGLTWLPRTEVTSQLHRDNFGSSVWTGPGHGFAASSGRLYWAMYHSVTGGPSPSACLVHTDDHGATFGLGADMGLNSGEPTAAELSDGRIMLNARQGRRVWQRAVGTTSDQGATWQDVARNPVLIEPTCEGALLGNIAGASKGTLLFANPASHRRERMAVRLSPDDGATWPHKLMVYEGSAAYSDIVDLGDGRVGVLFERDGYGSVTFSPIPLSAFPPTVTPTPDMWIAK